MILKIYDFYAYICLIGGKRIALYPATVIAILIFKLYKNELRVLECIVGIGIYTLKWPTLVHIRELPVVNDKERAPCINSMKPALRASYVHKRQVVVHRR